MAISRIRAVFQFDVQKVWRVVTSFDDCSWRSDLSKIEVLGENKFVEYTQNGYATTFNVTTVEPYSRLEFDMENENMKGHWTGVFSYNNGKTTVDFTENVVAKKLLMKPFVKVYLKSQQSKYIADLQKALSDK